MAQTHDTELPADLATWPFRKPRLEFQDKVFAGARDLREIALAPCATGTGKTYMSCNIAAHKYMTGQIDAVAIVAPNGVHRQWIEEAIPDCMTKAVRVKSAIWKPNMNLKKVGMLGSATTLRCLAFNTEAFSASSGRAAKALAEYMRASRVLLILDESTSVKNPKTERTKTLVGSYRRGKRTPGVAELAACRIILTGTPITKGVEDLWAQYEFLNPSIIGMSNFWAFKGRYCITAPAFRGAGLGITKIVGYRNMEEFVRKIAPVTFVVPKDVLGLPPKTYERIAVELTSEQKKIYNALRKKLVDDLAARRIVSPANAAVRLVRLQQVLCGRVLVREDENPEAPSAITTIPSNRLDAVIHFITDNPDPTVWWCRFTADILELEARLRKLGRKPVLCYGDISSDSRATAKKDFMNGDATDFIANPATASKGLDGLQHASDRAIYYSGSFNREHRWQSEDRLHRLGTAGTVTILDVVAGPGKTVDHMILESYDRTEELVKDFMKHPALLPEV